MRLVRTALLVLALFGATSFATPYAVIVNGARDVEETFLSFNAASMEFYGAFRSLGIPAENIIALDGDFSSPDVYHYQTGPVTGADDPGLPPPIWDETGNASYSWHYRSSSEGGGFFTNKNTWAAYDYDGDGLSEVSGAWTLGNLQAELFRISKELQPGDTLTFALSAHGNNNGGMFEFTTSEGIHTGAELRAAFDVIPDYVPIDAVISTCSAGAAWNQLGDRFRTAITQTDADNYGWAFMPVYDIDALHFDTWQEPMWSGCVAEAIRARVNPNGDRYVTWSEVHEYAYAEDVFSIVNRPPTSAIFEVPSLFGDGGVAIFTAPMGDANLDGAVTDGDYTIWSDNYGASGARWVQGDFNGDGFVGDADYTLWADAYAGGVGVIPDVPAPLTLAVLYLGFGPIFRTLRT